MKLVASIAACALFATSAAAQDVASFYKGKTVRIVVGFSAGGGYDHYARVVARHIGRHIPGNPNVIVQNMPGAASLNSVRYLATAAPTDGTVINAFNPGLITQSLTVPQKIGANFLDFAWLGSVTEDFRVCHTWNGTGIKDWTGRAQARSREFRRHRRRDRVLYRQKILSDLFGVKVHQVTRLSRHTEKRIAIERGELDGDCIGWTSVPEHWVRENKVTVHLRFSRTLVGGIPESVAGRARLLTDERKQQILDCSPRRLWSGGPISCRRRCRPTVYAALRAAFEATLNDKEFVAEIEKQRLTVTPMDHAEVEAFIKQFYQSPPDVVAAAKHISGD